MAWSTGAPQFGQCAGTTQGGPVLVPVLACGCGVSAGSPLLVQAPGRCVGSFYQPAVRLVSMRYHVYLEAEPTLESYRLSHQPRPGYGPVFICPFVVLTDSAGQLYNAMRGVQGQNKNETMNMGVYQLNGQLDDQCPVLFPYQENPIAERYHVTETADFVSYVDQTWRFDFGVDRYRWSDGGERLSLEARRLGQVCTFWVPEQEGYEYPQIRPGAMLQWLPIHRARQRVAGGAGPGRRRDLHARAGRVDGLTAAHLRQRFLELRRRRAEDRQELELHRVLPAQLVRGGGLPGRAPRALRPLPVLRPADEERPP
jgi:hypothetical protein